MTPAPHTASVESVVGGPITGDRLPDGVPFTNHGRTVAAWALFWFGALASVIAAVGFILPSTLWVIVGCVVFVVGCIVSIVLRAAGLGQAKRQTEGR